MISVSTIKCLQNDLLFTNAVRKSNRNSTASTVCFNKRFSSRLVGQESFAKAFAFTFQTFKANFAY